MNELPTSEIEDKEIGGAELCKATKMEAIQITLCLIVLLEETASGSLNIADIFIKLCLISHEKLVELSTPPMLIEDRYRQR